MSTESSPAVFVARAARRRETEQLTELARIERTPATKNTLERGTALVMFVLSAPLLLLLSLCVLLLDGRPVLYRGQRLGLRQKRFTMFKFRTLFQGADRKTANRPLESRNRLEIRGGRLLRDSRLDELPQLWNIVLGQMAFIGPRPELPSPFQARDGSAPDEDSHFQGRPGLVGPSQLFTPHGSPRRIRAWIDRAWARKEKRGWAGAGLTLYAALAMGRKLATRVLEFVLEDLLRSKLLRRCPQERKLRRVKTGAAFVTFARAWDSRTWTQLRLVDINDEAFLIHSKRPLEKGAAFRVRLEIELAGGNGGRRVRRARCLAIVVQQRRRGAGYALVLEYWPLRPLSHYVIQQYFLRNSLASPRGRKPMRKLSAPDGSLPVLKKVRTPAVRRRAARAPTSAACTVPVMFGLAAVAALFGPAGTDAQETRASEPVVAGAQLAGVREARISPDGALVVFAAAREPSGTVELYSVPLDGGQSPSHIGGPLVPSAGYRWEIDSGGRRVVYIGPDLSSVALDGDSLPVRLGDPAAPTRDFVLSPDGARVVHRAAPPGRYAGLFSVAADGSTPPIELVAPNELGEVEHTYQISPDGDSVVFVSHHEDGSIAKLYRAPIHGGPIVVLDHRRAGIDAFRISPDGGRVVYRCSRDSMGTSELYSVPLDGSQEPARLDVTLTGAGDVQDFEISPDGSWVAYLADQGSGRNALFGVPTDGSAGALELGGDVTSSFQIHPAGLLVLHAADRERDENFELRGVAIDGSAQPFALSAPLPPPGHVGWFGVTPDTTRIVYQTHRFDDQGGRISELWQVSLQDGLRTRLAETGAGSGFQISPDGRRVFYRDADRLSGLALDGNSAPVALASGLAPGEFRISPDGSRVLYLTRGKSANDQGLASVRADGGPAIRLHSPDARRTVGGSVAPGTQASTAGGTGFRDFSFGNSGNPKPTGEKPESKLWWNDGAWWASLYVDATQDYHIFALNSATQSWVDTGTVLDDRTSTNADVLWDDATQKLYVASHVFTTDAVPTASGWGRLYRYSYSSAAHTYARDPGFPVDITRGSAEALTIAKDSTGRLWAAWVEGARVMVNHSLASDSAWRTPFALPAASSVSTDDICSIIAFGGDRVGVMWSNQLESTVYFTVHRDAEEGTVWQPPEVVLPGAGCSGACADDHMNLKADAEGRVFAVLKTSLTEPDQPLNLVVVRGASGGWGRTEFGLVRDNHTRGILLLEEARSRVHVFATSPTGGGIIYHKSAALTDLRFEPGVGTPFIQSATDLAINDATSTKQNVDARTGIVVLAGDETTRFYLHNFMDLGTTLDLPTIATFAPTSGPVGTSVTITGTHLGGTTGVRFNGTPAAFSVLSDTEIRATVPGGATTGRISVNTPGGTATSSGAFTVTQSLSIHSFSPTSGPVGTSVTVTGAGFIGTTGVRFNGTPASFSVVSDTQIRTTVPAGATTGRISVITPDGTATSSGAFTVTQAPSIHSFSPTSGPVGTSVTVTGVGFTGATGVSFNGSPAAFRVVSSMQIQTTVPAGATSGRISVITPGGTATSSGAFTVTQPPSIHSFSPTSGPVGTSVTVTGVGFAGTSGVSLDGRPAGFHVVSGTQIQFTVPAGATSGRIRVTTPSGSAVSASDFRVTEPPVVESFLPGIGVVLTPVAISGRSFTGATSVKFNGRSAPFEVINSGLILTSVPVGATTGRISVTTPAGTGTSATNFVVIGL